MPFTITHTFVSAIPDNPADIILGKVVPSNWNGSHTIAGSIGAHEVTNIPVAPVTATDVQAAINQLASLIPAPGPGTDPLFLTKGLSVIADNPTVSGDQNDRWSAKIQLITDCAETRPTFANNSALQMLVNATHGQCTNVAGTVAKQTFFAGNMICVYNASGQKFVQNNECFSYGMGDCGIHGNDYVQYSGGPVGGDEGQAWGLVSNLTQQPYLNTTTISAVPVQSVVNTTTTQVITPSKDPQTVTVVDTTGAVNGDWVVIGQEIPSSLPNLEAVQIISFTPTSITAIFDYHHNNGVTVTPALRLSCVSTYQMGQDRVLVNMSQPSYSAGTVVDIIGGGFDGLGTNWANNMVGGYALNIGAIALAADDYTGTPFDAVNRLKSWYQIGQVTSPTHLTIYRTDAAGSSAYLGKGPISGSGNPASTYIIRPAARVLRIMAVAGSVTGELICETSTSTWAIGDTVEQVICPYADVSGFLYAMSHYANGGQLRRFMRITNQGARTCETVFEIDALGPVATGDPTADTVAYNIIMNVGATCNVGFACGFARQSAIVLSSALSGGGRTDAGNFIHWGSDLTITGCGLGPNSANSGLTLNGLIGAVSPSGALQFVYPGAGINTDPNNAGELVFGGFLRLLSVAVTGALGNSPAYIQIDRTAGANIEKGFVGWDPVSTSIFKVGTQKEAAGGARDMILVTDDTERLRFFGGGGIKFTDPADFSANGGVATALTSVGPAGANTTVQTWLTIRDNTNTIRYIPCF